MKTEKNILIAFLLNLFFSVFEFLGGMFCGSVAIVSDAVHDLGDAVSIGAAFFLEKQAKKQPDKRYTYGYLRYSVLGGFVTSQILLLGSVGVIANAFNRFFHPTEIHYDGMLLFAVVGVVVNFAAAWFTHGGQSINQRAVNLHMLEDVLGWAVVLVGAVVMRFTDFVWIDPLLSVGVAVFILHHAFLSLGEVIDIFLEKVPAEIDTDELTAHILQLDGVHDVHHLHIRSLDGHHHDAAMHIVADGDPHEVKDRIRRELSEHGIEHVTLELEAVGEECRHRHCHVEHGHGCEHHGHHHHHHH